LIWFPVLLKSIVSNVVVLTIFEAAKVIPGKTILLSSYVHFHPLLMGILVLLAQIPSRILVLRNKGIRVKERV